MRDEKGNKENSIKCTGLKLRRFFAGLDVALTSLTPERCEVLYAALRTAKCKPQKRKAQPDGAAPATEPAEVKTISVDYHRNALAEAKTFLRWCVKKGRLAANPAEHVEGTGRRNHGKEQLRRGTSRGCSDVVSGVVGAERVSLPIRCPTALSAIQQARKSPVNRWIYGAYRWR